MQRTFVLIAACAALSCGWATAAETGVDVYNLDGTWQKTTVGAQTSYIRVVDFRGNRNDEIPTEGYYFDAGFFALTDQGVELNSLESGVWSTTPIDNDSNWAVIDSDGKARSLELLRPNGDYYRYWTDDFVTWTKDLKIAGEGYTLLASDELGVNRNYVFGPNGLEETEWLGFWNVNPWIPPGPVDPFPNVYDLIENDRNKFRTVFGVNSDGLWIQQQFQFGPQLVSDEVYWDLAGDYTVNGTFAVNADGVDFMWWDSTTFNNEQQITNKAFTDIASDPNGFAVYGIDSSGLWKVYWDGADWQEEQISTERYARIANDSLASNVVYAYGGAVLILGDFDVDGDVDGSDFLAWQRGESPDPLSSSDLVDWQANFGESTAVATAVVPAPTAMTLLSGALLTLCLFRRRPEK